MSILNEIIKASEIIDREFHNISQEELDEFELKIPVPKDHTRAKTLQEYSYKTEKVANVVRDDDLVLVDEHIQIDLDRNCACISLRAIENQLKDISYLEEFVKSLPDSNRIVGVGGGLVLNAVGYIAESLEKDLVYFPTSITAAADSTVGGKVRANRIDKDNFHKHFHKTFYEPNFVCVDWDFFTTLNDKQITVGLAEIIKHGLYQSDELSKYLLSSEFNPIEDTYSLKKAILWTVNLKKVALDIDPEESPSGSYYILRGGHDISDQIEEQSGLTIPHTEAVLTGMYRDLRDTDKIKILEEIYAKFNLEEFKY